MENDFCWVYLMWLEATVLMIGLSKSSFWCLLGVGCGSARFVSVFCMWLGGSWWSLPTNPTLLEVCAIDYTHIVGRIMRIRAAGLLAYRAGQLYFLCSPWPVGATHLVLVPRLCCRRIDQLDPD